MHPFAVLGLRSALFVAIWTIHSPLLACVSGLVVDSTPGTLQGITNSYAMMHAAPSPQEEVGRRLMWLRQLAATGTWEAWCEAMHLCRLQPSA